MSVIRSLGNASAAMAGQSIRLAHQFDKMDTDKGGSISLDEFKAAGQKVPARQNKPASDLEALFNKIDADGDGGLTAEELKAYHRTMVETGLALLKIQQAAIQ
jgi:Ca2+-binding EF-hand superfamily protein